MVAIKTGPVVPEIVAISTVVPFDPFESFKKKMELY
jgi:hypothetical protein